MEKSNKQHNRKRQKGRNFRSPHKKNHKVSLKDLIRTVSSRSYYALTAKEKRMVDRAEEVLGLKINGWSFTPNPQVLSSIYKNEDKDSFARFIFVIETLRADIYCAVREFLTNHTINVNSYFTGGSADFICDVPVTSDYKKFYNELQGVLKKAGVEEVADVKNLITVFRVDEALILCRKKISDIGSLDSGILQNIQNDLVKFELACRDYRAVDAIAVFGKPRGLQNYLNDLEKGKAIVGYHARMDDCQHIDREYVPVCEGGRKLDKLLKEHENKSQLVLKHAVEILKVSAVEFTDETDKAVTHIFINEYDKPGDRNQWKQTIYKALGNEVNIFTYPLDGTISQSPIILSDLPEAIDEARQYSGEMHLGYLDHPSGPRLSEKICLQLGSFANQGVTLGIPGTGKTNTDCVLIEEAINHLRRILIIDSKESHSIKDKEPSFPERLKNCIKYKAVPEGASAEALADIIKSCVEGCFVIETPANMLPQVLEACLNEIASSTTKIGDAEREVDSLLLVEEANDAIGKDESQRRRIVGRLDDILNKAYRFGWCIWLSTQRPSHLGYDNVSALKILTSLKNKILHQLDATDIPLIEDCLKGSAVGRLKKKISQLTELKKKVLHLLLALLALTEKLSLSRQ